MTENMVPTNDSTEEMASYSGANVTLTRKVLAILILMSVVMGCLLIYQNVQKHKMMEEHAYVSAVMISLQEEHLVLKYGLLPSQVGLSQLRDAWIDNPCYETTVAYCDGLTRVIEELEKSPEPTKDNYLKGLVTVSI